MVFDASRRLAASICKSLGGGFSIENASSAMGLALGILALRSGPLLLDLAFDFGGGADDDLVRIPVPTLFLGLRASSLASDGMKSIPFPLVCIDGCDESNGSNSPEKSAFSSGGGAVAFIGCGGGDLAFIVDVLTFTFADAAWNVGYADVDADAASAGGGDVAFAAFFASAWDAKKAFICS